MREAIKAIREFECDDVLDYAFLGFLVLFCGPMLLLLLLASLPLSIVGFFVKKIIGRVK